MLEVFGAIFIIIFGSLMHFIYDWSNHNKIIGYFAAVNESTWEHLKLVIAPSFMWFIVEYHYYIGNNSLYLAKFISMIIMISIIPLIFYSYTKFTKKHLLVIDIGSFIVAVIVGHVVFHYLMKLDLSNVILMHIGIIGLIITFLRFMTHTYVPDKNFMHKDPITNKYGIDGHK